MQRFAEMKRRYGGSRMSDKVLVESLIRRYKWHLSEDVLKFLSIEDGRIIFDVPVQRWTENVKKLDDEILKKIYDSLGKIGRKFSLETTTSDYGFLINGQFNTNIVIVNPRYLSFDNERGRTIQGLRTPAERDRFLDEIVEASYIYQE